MKKIVKATALERFELSRKKPFVFEEKDEPYKVELIRDLPEDAVKSACIVRAIYRSLCRAASDVNKPVKAFRLMKIAGAYWRGNEKNKMLTRIYGTAYTKNADLEAYVTMLEEAKKRDHRKTG